MKFQYCSDLHVEFRENRKFLKSKPIKPIGEVLLLAGDILVYTEIEKNMDFFKYLSDNFRKTYWIPGNHEYYQSNIAERSGTFQESILPNVILTNNRVYWEGSTKLILSTLWSKISETNHGMIEYNMHDFRVIRHNGWKLSANVYNEYHKECLRFISEELFKDDNENSIVATHHIPTYINYPAKFKNDILNEAFAVELRDLIEMYGPSFWIFGHHHQKIDDFVIGKTKLVNNQLGYVHLGESDGFKTDLVLDI